MKRFCFTLVLIAITGFSGVRCSQSLSLHGSDNDGEGSENGGGSSDDVEDSSETASDEMPATSLPPANLVINELLYDSAESDSDGNVFVELYGTPGGNLGGYVIRLVNGADGTATDEMVLPAGSLVPDDGLFVVADSKTGSSSETNVANADFLDNFDPQNGPDSIQLFDPSGELKDVVGYGEGLSPVDSQDRPLYEGVAATTVAAGASLSRVSMSDTGDNAADFAANELPSPGSAEVTNSSLSPEESEDEMSLSAVEGVHFTEVATDPQQDWSDTEGGNGIAFDAVAGSGTVGTTDEWIEIKNGASESVDLTVWRLEMIDGTDASELFASPTATLVFFDGGDVANFNPDEFLVIGNPSGDLKNAVTLQLYDEADLLVDELVIDDANATGMADESYRLLDDGTWEMGEATIGF